jgi:hypothetical protein
VSRLPSASSAQNGDTTTEPPDNDDAPTSADIEKLLRRCEDALATIIADPGVVLDRPVQGLRTVVADTD